MHLANCSNALSTGGNEPTSCASHNITLRRWLPGLLLVAALAAASVLGQPNGARTEVDWLHRLSNTGDTGAQLQLGLAYRDGLYGLKPDAKTGLYWLKQAAGAGNVYAEDAVGEAYATGQGTEPNPELASQWWRKAVNDGSSSARIHLSEALIASGHLRQATQLLK